LPSPAESAATAEGAPQEAAADEVFVRAIDLPTPSLRQARAAVAQQIDILSPLPPADTAWSLVLLGPSENGLSRFAVGFVPRRLLEQRAPGGAAVRLTGRLDDQDVVFRFDNSTTAGAPVDWMRVGAIAGVCLAIVLAGANVRIDRELDQTQTRLDAATQVAQQRARKAADASRVFDAWRAAAATHGAGMVDCALSDLVKASGGSAKLAKLELADGKITAWLSAPAADAAVSALRALGATPVLDAPAGPAAAAADPAAAPAVRQFQIAQAACG
jgi:hypothetical protein